jgi:hypothetical protein
MGTTRPFRRIRALARSSSQAPNPNVASLEWDEIADMSFIPFSPFSAVGGSPDGCRSGTIVAIERQRFVEECEQGVERLEVSRLSGPEMLDAPADAPADQVGLFAELHDEGAANRREWAAGLAQL